MSISAIKDMAMRSVSVEDAASLTWGLPSFRTPAPIREAVQRALETDVDIGKYALPDGLPALRRLVASTHLERTGIEIDSDEHVMITAGNTEGLNTTLHAILDPGDEIILTDPGFPSHFQQIRLCGGVSVGWAMNEEDGWSLDVDGLSSLTTPRTQGLILVSPPNPTGKIFTEPQLRRIGEIALERNLLILLDDPYSAFTYENRSRYFNLAAVPELSGHLVYFFTFSKAYAMSGWRLAYAIMPAWLKREVLKVHDATIICTPRISQVAGISALSTAPTHLAAFEASLAKRRKLICDRLDAVRHVFSYVRPEGAYYVFPRILVEHQTSYDFAIDLLDEAKVTVTPGSAFGAIGEHHVRMAYCVDEATIETAFDRIEQRYPG
jgi:aspartate/methionine/tyrosine aminotransferase